MWLFLKKLYRLDLLLWHWKKLDLLSPHLYHKLDLK